jgi:hypothetical protein
LTFPELDNLVTAGSLKRLPATPAEIARLLHSGRARLADAQNPANAIESRFDLAYNAAHSIALAALRFRGYRSENRYLVFQCLEHAAGIPASTWRVFARAHSERNLIEYQGGGDIDEKLVSALVAATQSIETVVAGLLA